MLHEPCAQFADDVLQFLPPPGSPPPFEPYSASHPAEGNSNGILPTGHVARPKPRRHFLGGILPLSFLPSQRAAPHDHVGGGQSGVFANMSARPDNSAPSDEPREDGPEWANEDERKDAPPSYQSALRDAVPPYWDTTVVLPSSSSPFGPLSSSINGDEILIDGMGAGNFFGFFWNLVVSVSFQFVGFLLTYVLHTTHAAKFGSRAGLGITLIQVGFSIRKKAEEMLKKGVDSDYNVVDPATGKSQADIDAEDTLVSWGTKMQWPQPWQPPLEWGGHGETYVLHSVEEAEAAVHKYNHTLKDIIGLPSDAEVGRANEWFAFMLMTIGWFLVLASVGGWWRVKRFEHKLKQAQQESERAQRAARGDSLDGLHPDEGDDPTPTRTEPGPNELSYYTSAFTQAFNGVRELQRGFFGMRGRPANDNNISRGDTVFDGDDEAEHELLEAQGYGLEPMARDSSAAEAADSPRRTRGLWQ